MKSKAGRLRELISKGAVMMPGVPNASMARQVEQAGFDAVYVSGAGMANSTAGVPDIGLLSMEEVTRLAGYVAHAVKIPAIVDADTGFGEGEAVAQTIRELEKAGLAGCHIEDQEFPKRCGHLAGKTIVDLKMMIARIKSAVLPFKQLSDFGYRMVIFPQSAFRVSMKATEKFFAALKKAGKQSDWLDQMQTRQELYDLLDYDPAAEEWKGFRD